MTQYIPKSFLVAEIDNIKKHYIERDDFDNGWNFALDKVLSFIYTLEVKEVDLNREVESYFKGFGKFPSVGIDDCIDIAKHFFELGMLNTITEKDCKLIWNIGDEIPYMPEEKFFKELLKRYKAQKGE